MKIISVNAGSSSLKFTLFEMDTKDVLISGLFERIGIAGSRYVIKYKGEKLVEEVPLETHTDAANILLKKLVELKVVNSLEEIDGVGHRAVQGGDDYTESVIIDDAVIEGLKRFSPLAPLHNPANILGINAFKEALPNTPMVAVFDTAFHQSIPVENYTYAVPYEWYQENNVRRYGFHGTSHRFITKTISEVLNNDHLKIINCHLGNGSSLAAIKDGKCIDTSMGFTPLAGIVMGTRAGDIDASIIPYIMKARNMTIEEVESVLNKNSGFLGISGRSSDNRDIESGVADGDERCILTQNMFINSVVSYIAKYFVELGGCDVLCFTAGIGENGIGVRKAIVDKLACLGIYIDDAKNDVRGKLTEISREDSKVKVYLVPTDEELMIAMDTLELISK